MPEDITTVDDEMYKDMSAQLHEADALACARKKESLCEVCVKFV